MVEEIKTKEIICTKGVGGQGEMVTCSYKNKQSEINMHPSDIRLSGVKCSKGEFGDMNTCQVMGTKKFKEGDMWSSDFNYCGMLEAGKKAKLSDGVVYLNKLFDSFEDVNYHKESEPLIESIRAVQRNEKDLAEKKIKEFNKLSSDAIKRTC